MTSVHPAADDDADDAGDVAGLQRIAVIPAKRRRRLAGQLLRRCDLPAFARTLLVARADNAPALGFQRREGLAETGRRRSYNTDGTDAFVRRR